MYSVVASDGKVYGPVDTDTLKAWCAEGRVTPESNLVDGVSGRVVKAREISDLYGLFPAEAPPVNRPPMAGQSQAPVQVNNYIGTHPVGHPIVASTQKSKVAAGLLALFLGPLGIHRFYLGYNGSGIAMLLITVLTCGWGIIVTGLWALIDCIVIFIGGMNDSDGRALV